MTDSINRKEKAIFIDKFAPITRGALPFLIFFLSGIILTLCVIIATLRGDEFHPFGYIAESILILFLFSSAFAVYHESPPIPVIRINPTGIIRKGLFSRDGDFYTFDDINIIHPIHYTDPNFIGVQLIFSDGKMLNHPLKIIDIYGFLFSLKNLYGDRFYEHFDKYYIPNASVGDSLRDIFWLPIETFLDGVSTKINEKGKHIITYDGYVWERSNLFNTGENIFIHILIQEIERGEKIFPEFIRNKPAFEDICNTIELKLYNIDMKNIDKLARNKVMMRPDKKVHKVEYPPISRDEWWYYIVIIFFLLLGIAYMVYSWLS